MKRDIRMVPYQSNAFSLVEILVSVAILSILMTLLVPSWQAYQKMALSTHCASNLRQLGTAFFTYAAENNGQLPPGYANPGIPGQTMGERVWYQYLMFHDVRLYKGDGVLPNPNWSWSPGDGGNQKDVLTIYNCPANPYRLGRWETPSYAYSRGFGTFGDANGYPFNPTRLAAIEQPSQTILLVDAGERYLNGQSPQNGPPMSLCYISGYNDSTFYWQRSVNFDVHGGRANFLFVDGHVETLNHSEVQERGSLSPPTLLWSRGNASSGSAFW